MIEYKILSIDDKINEYIFVLNKEMTVDILNARNKILLSDELRDEYIADDSIFFVRIQCTIVDKINPDFKNNKLIRENDLIDLFYNIDQKYLLRISYITTNTQNYSTNYFKNIIEKYPVKTYKDIEKISWNQMHNLMILTLYGYDDDQGYNCFRSRSNDEVYVKSEIIGMITEIYQECYVKY